MAHVDDLIQARAQKIALTAIALLSRLHPILSANHLCAERITKRICKESAGPITFSGKSVRRRTAVSDSNSTASEILTDDYEMAQRGATVFQYDHTITASPQHHAALRFYPVRVGPVDGESVRTIQALLEENGHATELEMILKMDIEGSEWDVLDQSSSATLNRFKQIICEFHGFSELHNPSWCERAERVLLKLTESHLPVHVHGNNFASFNIVEGVPVPDVIEVTYARRSSYSFEPSATRFPTNLDRPNNPSLPDFYLGRFEF